VPLSGTEFRLLRIFLGHPNRVLTREQLIDLMAAREALYRALARMTRSGLLARRGRHLRLSNRTGAR
jgi:DNA-binding response OmpR family regulator